jgi:hypothetical protein
MREGDYEAVLRIMRSGKSWQSQLDKLRDLMASTDDGDLRIYLGDVLQLVGSPYVETVGVSPLLPLPLHRPPFKTLVEYCERQLKLSNRPL